jgi:hypothetical protein
MSLVYSKMHTTPRKYQTATLQKMFEGMQVLQIGTMKQEMGWNSKVKRPAQGIVHLVCKTNY